MVPVSSLSTSLSTMPMSTCFVSSGNFEGCYPNYDDSRCHWCVTNKLRTHAIAYDHYVVGVICYYCIRLMSFSVLAICILIYNNC